MSTAALKSLGIVTGSVGLYVFYDYQTCHPMRQMQYEPQEAIVRLHNTFYRHLLLPLSMQSTMKLSELAKFNGQNNNTNDNTNKKTYFSAGGTIYDVSSSEMFASAYQQWAGKDATVALAKMSLSPNDINRTDIWKNLTQSDQQSLQSWIDYFDQKYYIKGCIYEYYNDTDDNGK